MDQNKILTMAGKSPDRHWKTTDYKMSGQLKKLEKKQTELLKTFDRHDADVKAQLAENKSVTAERVYRWFFETYDELEENRQQQRKLLKPKYLDSFDADTEQKLGERKNVLQWLVEKVPQLKKFEECRTEVINCKDAIRLVKLDQKFTSFYREMFKLEEEFKKENLSDSLKQTLCNKLEELLTTLDINSAEAIQLVKPDVRFGWFMVISNNRNYYTDLLKKYQQTAESRNQTSLVSTTSARGTGPNETVVQTGIAVTENVEENADVSSRNSETHRSGKEPSIANSHSSKTRVIDQLELENMRAKGEADQRLRERQSQLEKEREEIELCRRQEELRLHLQQQQQEQELRLQLQQQKDELRLRQHERELENESSKTGAD